MLQIKREPSRADLSDAPTAVYQPQAAASGVSQANKADSQDAEGDIAQHLPTGQTHKRFADEEDHTANAAEENMGPHGKLTILP